MSKKHQHSIFSMCKSIVIFCAFVLLLCSIIFWRCSPVPEPQPKEETDTIVIDTIQDTIPADTIPTDTIPIHLVDTEDCCPTGELNPAEVVILKFSDTTQINNVVLCKQKRENYGLWGDLERLFNSPIEDFDFYGMDSLNNISDYEIFNKHLQLPHSSPYIELIDGYYMIDWRWIGIFPTQNNADGSMKEAYANNVNVLPIKWKDLDDVFIKYDKYIQFNSFQVERATLCLYGDLDAYRNAHTPIIGANEWNVYADMGISADLAMRTYQQQGEKALETFVSQADSIFNCYKNTIIKALKNNEFYKIDAKELYY